MSSLHFLLHSSSETVDNFHEKVRDLASNISKNGYKVAPVFETLGSALISQCVLSDSHIALLLQDGRVCRTTYSLLTDKLDITSKVSDSKSSSGTTTAGVSSYSTSVSAANARLERLDRLARQEQSTASSLATLASAASAVVTRPVAGTIAVSGAGSANSRGSRASRILHAVTSAGGRPAGVLLGRPPIPSSLVPNELVDQCLSVLQGKSRSLIIRELQRTNLDVNLAVNNLLSRDDEGDEDDDSQDGYMPGDDLMSLLDSGAPGDHSAVLMDAAEALMTDDLLSYHPIRSRVAGRQSQAASSNSASRAALASSVVDDESLRSDREPSFLRLRERRWLDTALREENADIRSSVERCFNLMRSGSSEGGSSRKVESKSTRNSSTNSLPSSSDKNNTKSSPPSLQNVLSFGEQLQFMTMPESGASYCQITALYSELLVLDTHGKLHQWKWSEQDPFSSTENAGVHHPKSIPLLLSNEKVVGISSSLVRASVWTESSKVAVWPDETLALVGGKLEHAATSFPEFEGSSIKHVYTSSLYTCAWLDNGCLYWWGVLPTPLRKKLLERAHQKSKKSKEKDRSANDIITGQQVCMKSNPLYHAGAIAFNLSGSMPKVGQLMASAWSWSDVCRFQLKKKCTPEPKQDKARGADINFDMPPPPSPASSTCSEQSGPILVSPGSATAKRKRQPTPIKDLDKGVCDEEDWNIKDCIVIEDGKAANPVGRVIKIDGSFAAVKFSNTSDPVDDPLHNVRLLRKEDLQVVRGATSSKLPEVFQVTPRKVSFSQGQCMAVSVLDNEFHLVVQNSSTNALSYVTYDMMSNQFSDPYLIPAYHSAMVNKKSLSLFKHFGSPDSVPTCDGGITLLQDGNSTLYPLLSNSTQTFNDPRWFDLLPIQSLAAHSESLATVGEPTSKNRLTMVAVALRGADMIRHILRCDVTAVGTLLANISQEPNGLRRGSMLQDIVDELADGAKNILHLCVALCRPTTNKEVEEVTTSSLGAALDAYSASNRTDDAGYRDMNPMMRRPTGGAPDKDFTFAWSLIHEMGAVAAGGATIPPSSGSTMWTMPAVNMSDKDRRYNATAILNVLCESPLLEPYLKSLLSARNTDGLTPFMQAVSTRAYSVGNILFMVAKQNASVSGTLDQEAFMSMLYPTGCNPDDNPFLLLCCNDTCSFTWTGTDHINQDIYECKTCGLTGSLCCCSECARVCHKGHNCKLKVTSPTAYCDCWERCKCKALIAGNQNARYDLLNKLLLETDLVKLPNSRGEDVLLFLVQTVGRQQQEQKQHTRRLRSTVVRKNSQAPADADPNVPEHDLEPPKFAKRALERILNDWNAVKCMILNGYSEQQEESASESLLDDQSYLRNQSGSHLLDKFTHSLMSKCTADMLDALLTTLIREMQTVAKASNKEEALLVTRRFIRSVVRIFVVRSVECSSESSMRTSSSKSAHGITVQTLLRCKHAFQAVVHISVQELCKAANALVLPVTLGVVKPTAAFSLLTSTSLEMVQDNEDLFLADPLPQRASGTDPTAHQVHLDNTIQSEMADRSALYDEEELDNMARDQYEPDEAAAMLQSLLHTEGQASAPSGEMIPLADAAELDMDGGEQEPEYQADPPEGESDMDLDLLAESDSDNDSVHGGSVHSMGTYDEAAQGAPGSSSNPQINSAEGMQMAFFSEDDSNSSDEEVDSDDGQDSDQEYDNALDVEQLERRSTESGTVSQRSHQAPQSMRWALRQPSVATSSGSRQAAAGGSSNPSAPAGLIYLEPSSLRRGNSAAMSNTLSAAAVQTATIPMAQMGDGGAGSHSITSTANNLTRAFGIIMRQIADLINTIKDYRASAPSLPRVLDYTERDVQQLKSHVESQLRMPWNWLVGVMDSTEAQLRFGTALVSSTDSTNPNHPMNPSYGRQAEQSTNSRVSTVGRPNPGWTQAHRRQRLLAIEAGSGRQGFLSYMLSLLRSHNDEHAGSVPSVDVLALKHVAYVFDAMIYYMKCSDEEEPDLVMNTDKVSDQSWPEQEDEDSKMSADSFVPEDLTSSSNRHPFFHRSESTTFLGCVSPDPIHTPLNQALPLAERPQLLHPLARREEMFGISKQQSTRSQVADSKFAELPVHMGLSRHLAGSEADASPSLDTMGTYSADDPPQDEPADLSIPRSEANKPKFSDVLTKQSSMVQGAHDLSVLGLVPIVSKPTSVIVSNQTLLTDPSLQPSTSMTETFTEQTINAAGNRVTFFGEPITYESLIGRWRQTVQMFGHIFCDDVGSEPGSIISELGGFPVKETKFRRDMEKLRNTQQRDLSIEVDRDRNQLLVQTIKQLNAQYNKRAHYGAPYSPSLSAHRIKATFKSEPGEGSGVARSFYTDFSRAVTSVEKLPILEVVHAASGKKSAGKQSTASRRATLADSAAKLGRLGSDTRRTMSVNAPPYHMPLAGASSQDLNSSIPEPRRHLGVKILPRVQALQPAMASRITGMLLELNPGQLLTIVANDVALKEKVDEAMTILAAAGESPPPVPTSGANAANSSSQPESSNNQQLGGAATSAFSAVTRSKDSPLSGQKVELHVEVDYERMPLFHQPGKQGYYAPLLGSGSTTRLNAFRNVGRVMGLCLLQNEICPLYLCRPVIKYILGRPVRWHDLAFHDPTLYESLRGLLADTELKDAAQILSALDLNFTIDDESTTATHDLIPGGADVAITPQNIYCYIRKYAHYKMVKCCEKALEQLKSGVHDVIPRNSLEGLFAEDFRLLLNGQNEIDVQTLISYTSFNDESGESNNDKVQKFKRWFWSIAEKMNGQERQDLVYFWTSSPALPASEEGFQPMPTITIRPADDNHLPTANTCISRLYIPLYSSKQILKTKLVLAIKTKAFGFV